MYHVRESPRLYSVTILIGGMCVQQDSTHVPGTVLGALQILTPIMTL